MMKKFTIVLLLSCFASVLFAQTLKEFSKDPSEFLIQLETYVTKNKREDMALAYKKFREKHDVGQFNDTQFKDVQEVCDGMLKQKMNPAPFFLDYLNTLNIILNFEKSSTKLDEFNKTCKSIISDIENRNAKNYRRFLAFGLDFYEKKALRITSGSTWRVNAPKYELIYSNKDLYIDFPQVDLYGIRKDDSIKIEQTVGRYYPFTDMWKGERGQVSWERLGIKDAFVKLGKYEFEVKKNNYECTDATLHYPKYFPGKPIKGTFEDRIVVKSKSSKATYPRFQSDKKVLRIDNIGADVRYIGGFRLSGITAYGYGDKDNKAQLLVVSPTTKKTVMKARSLNFVIKEDVRRIVAEGTETVLYFGKDSIYHPSSNIRFEIDDKTINVQRGERGSDRNPFFDSYHNIRLDTDRIDWALESDSMLIGKKTVGMGGGDDKLATFESYHYFNEGEYRELQSISTTNPVAGVMAYSKELGSDVLDVEGLAKKLNTKFNISTIQSLLYSMVAKGFIDYDKENETIYIQEKLRHYALSAVKKTDYDNVIIRSKTKESNAILYLDDKNQNPIDIRAVNNIEFSEKQKVALKPLNNQVLLKQNRNMDFAGKVFAGMTIFQGKDFMFDYNGFQIQMDSIRYFDLFENSGQTDERNQPIAYGIGSRIEDVSGTLLIDAPHNKSGVEEINMFPSFTSDGYSFVYYDSQDIMDGAYKRDSFYFRLNKFGFNNLDNYMPSAINFKGQMYSSDIFTPFEEKLVLMEEDKSLGFIHDTPSDGYPVYMRRTSSGKGNYEGQINLSNKGFLGEGNIKYLAASIDSEDIIFKPSVLTCSARRFDLEEKRDVRPELPQVRGIDVSVRWRPYQDSMYVKPLESPFAMYQSGLHTLDGTLILTPGGLRANGLLDWDKASMTSKDFLFGAYSVTADTSNLSIKAEGATDKLAFDSRNMKASVDFDNGIGNFKANSKDISTNMPYNKFSTSMEEFDWDMNNETVTFQSKPGKKDEFLSVELDSLQFKGDKGLYDMKTSTLTIEGVPFVNTADALVYPSDGKIEVKAEGKITTLEEAKIIASERTKYHVINKATVSIKTGRDYTASGYYEYNIGGRKQEVLFSDIVGAPIGKGKRTKKKLATRGSGVVKEDEDFYIDKKTKFQGDIQLSSDRKELYFEGYAKLDMDLPQNNWFTVRSMGDKKNLAIEINKPVALDGQPLRTGLFVDRMSGMPYPATLSVLFSRKDRALMDVKGVFKYDKKADAFMFGDSLKLTTGKNYKGDIFKVSNRRRECTATGQFNIGEGVQFFQPTVVGQATMKLRSTANDTVAVTSAERAELNMNTMVGLSYLLPEKALKAMEVDLRGNLFDAPPINYDSKYKAMIPEVVGGLVTNKSAYKQVTGNFKSTGKITLPNKKKHMFFFSYLPMKWAPDIQSMVSREKMIGLSQVNGTSIHKMVEGYVEFRMPGNQEDGMHVYIKNPEEGGHYYYFKYKNGVLQTVSSNPNYNSAITGAKKKELEVKMGKEIYLIETVSPVSADLFVSRIKGAW